MSKEYKYIFFDLDNTFWDVEKNQKCALEELYATFNMCNHFNDFKQFYDTFIAINSQMWLDYRDGVIERTELRNDRYRRLLESVNIINDDLIIQMSDEYLRITPLYNNLIPHSIETLDYLLKKSYPMFLVTNGFNEVQFNKVAYSGMSKYFNKIITSEFAGANKPDISIYNYAIKESGCSKEEILMIGDDPYNDIYGAEQAGLDSVYFNASACDHDLSPTFEINSLLELKSIL